ncbi:hypothetical protein, partial [Desulfonatronum sp. SC1]|uniref:hypothetical protein n=1 Tax=Desulfonatronum sp. SC1 TaxID=2109626 RepID=UPI0018EEC159
MFHPRWGKSRNWLVRLWLLLLPLLLIPTAPAHAQFDGGTGTSEDPYLVATAEHLNNVRNHHSAYFRQTADIDLGIAPWNTHHGWVPIGASESRFRGHYDGAGNVIRNLMVNRSGTTHQGLFGSIENASIRNLRLENINVIGGNFTGGLAGESAGSAVQRVVLSGGQIVGGTNVGGLFGMFSGGLLHLASADAAV